ncbi:MAG: hypothetical protein LBS40_00900 [Burkholderiales bacterium]|jgi:hypothetical protein|nr:hypothetical protein [Burkholderiales bacterium]
MDIFRPPVTSNRKNSAWKHIENYVKVQPIRKIVVKDSVDMVFRRSDKPMLIVVGETADAVVSVKTCFNGDIEVFIRSEVRARVVGSGDILVRGNPPHRDHNVAGSGKIKFR